MTIDPKEFHRIQKEAPVIQKKMLRWGRSNYKDFPWRHPEKKWHGLLAELLLQRTRAEAVLPVYLELTHLFPNPLDLANAPKFELLRILRPLGLTKRADVIREFALEVEMRGEELPNDVELLKQLPGVGSYASTAFVSFHKGGFASIVDANVARWICRLARAECNGETRRKKWLIELATALTPKRTSRDYNYAVLDFTREICKSTPSCVVCPIGPRYCRFGEKRLK